MSDDKQITQHDDDWQGSWYSAPNAECEVCGFTWVAVYPSCCQRIECGQCGHMTRAPHLLERERPDVEPKEPWQT